MTPLLSVLGLRAIFWVCLIKKNTDNCRESGYHLMYCVLHSLHGSRASTIKVQHWQWETILLIGRQMYWIIRRKLLMNISSSSKMLFFAGASQVFGHGSKLKNVDNGMLLSLNTGQCADSLCWSEKPPQIERKNLQEVRNFPITKSTALAVGSSFTVSN